MSIRWRVPAMRNLTFVQAVREATDQLMAADRQVVVFGLDVDDPKAIQGTTAGLLDKYGPERVFGTPLSEDAMTGAAIGMAMAGMKPIHVHIRMDFLMLAMNQLVNLAAKAHYMYGGQTQVPLTIRTMIGKSWGQGAQHSQGLYSQLMNIPGIRVVAPSTPYDAKGTLIAAVRDPNPTLYVEQRLLHFTQGEVPEALYESPIGKARITRAGTDVTIVGVSYMALEAYRAAQYLADVGISAEVIDPIWLSPLDRTTLLTSLRKTGRLLAIDNGWTTCGASAEILAMMAESDWPGQAPKLARMGFAPSACPPSPVLEDLYYPNARTIAAKARFMVTGKAPDWLPEAREDLRECEFRGPF
jgi:pyruvate/2-oxoglutarate/acetoin dehydrogenase E1 component